jgi:hypothetical protein
VSGDVVLLSEVGQIVDPQPHMTHLHALVR